MKTVFFLAKAFFSALLGGLFSACALVEAAFCFEELSVEFSTPEEAGTSGWGNFAGITFSVPPEKNSAEALVTLTREGMTAAVTTRWEGATLLVAETPEWRPGKSYRLSAAGRINAVDGRTFTVKEAADFVYGEIGGALALKEFSLPQNREDCLRLTFNKAVSVPSFEEAFSLSPYCATTVSYDNEGKLVTVRAPGGWLTHKGFTASLKDLRAADGYALATPAVLKFTTTQVREKPQVTITGPGAGEKEVRVVFTKEMEESSVLNAFSLEPSVKGEFAAARESLKEFAFTPEGNYDIGKEYLVTIGEGARDREGTALETGARAFFTAPAAFLEVTGVTFDDGTAVHRYNENTAQTAVKISLFHPVSGAAQLQGHLRFDSRIEAEERSGALDCVTLKPVFPSTAGRAALIGAEWKAAGTELLLTWEGLTVSSGAIDNYYELCIRGGKTGVLTGRGEYLKEDLWLLLLIR